MPDATNEPMDAMTNEPTPERTDESTVHPGLGDEALAARIRGALDARVAPVGLDEITTLVDRASGDAGPSTIGVSGPRSGGTAALDRTSAPADAAGASVAVVDDPRSVERRVATVSRGRWPVVLAAAAVVLLVGVASIVVRTTSDDLTVDVGPADSGVAPAAGGVFDPDATVLHHKRVWGMAADTDGRVYLSYSVSADAPPDLGGADGGGELTAIGELTSQAEELENQAEAVGQEADEIEAEIAADPSSTGNALRAQQAQGLRDRQTDLRFQASEIRLDARLLGDLGRAHGLIVADARDGSVLADHALPGVVFGGSIDSLGANVWFVAEGDAGVNQLWTVTGAEPPRAVADLPGPMDLAMSEDGLWVRGVGVLQRRDPIDGALLESSGAPVWAARGALAAGANGTWAADTTSVVRVDGVEPGPSMALPGVAIDVGIVLVAGGSVLTVGGVDVARFDVATSSVAEQLSVGSSVAGADARGDRAWVVADAADPAADLVEVLEIDGATGEHRSAMVPMIGEVPSVVALDGGGAVLCTAVERVLAADAPEPPANGSSCQRVASPLDDPTPDGVPAPDELSAPPISDTSTTSMPPTVPMSSAPTSTPPAPALDPAGISFEGLAPIRLGMTVDELRAEAGFVVESPDPCNAAFVEVVGLFDGVVVTFRGDFTVGSISISTDDVATADGLRVGSTVEQLTAVHPDLQVNDPVAPTVYILVADDRSSGIFFSTRDGVVTEISVLGADDTFVDACAAVGAS